MKVGRWLHTRFRVENLEKSLDFYQKVLGLRKVSETTSPRGSRLVFLQPEAGGEMLELCHYPQSGSVRVPQDLTHIAFEVENLESFGQHASQLGFPWSDGPHEGANGSKFAFLDAPEGYEVEIIQRGQPS